MTKESVEKQCSECDWHAIVICSEGDSLFTCQLRFGCWNEKRQKRKERVHLIALICSMSMITCRLGHSGTYHPSLWFTLSFFIFILAINRHDIHWPTKDWSLSCSEPGDFFLFLSSQTQTSAFSFFSFFISCVCFRNKTAVFEQSDSWSGEPLSF